MYTLRKAAGRFTARGLAAAGLMSTLLLAGCHNLFVCQKASCPSSGSGSGGSSGDSGSTTTDYAYVSNAAKGSTYISEYDIGNGSLSAISGSPFNMGFAPVAMVVSPNNSYLYAATPAGVTTPGIYLFSIGTTGALSVANGGAALVTNVVSTMDISPDGNFLFMIDALGANLYEYQISSGGLLGLAATLPLPGGGCTLAGNPSGGTPLSQTCTVRVAPSGQFVVASVGTQGTYIFPYSSSSGISSTGSTHIASTSTSGDFSVTLDKNNYIYIARTSALAVYQITDTSGDATLRSNITYTSSTTTPRSVVLSSSQDDVYTANLGSGNISGYSISAGALTALTGSPFTGPASVSAIGVDKSGTYMVAAGYDGSSGIQLFTIGSDGTLKLTTSAGTGTSMDSPAILAMTH